MSESQTIHLLVIALCITTALFIFFAINSLILVRKLNQRNEEIDDLNIDKEKMITDLKSCYTHITHSNEDLISNNENGKFNWRIKSNRSLLSTLREKYYNSDSIRNIFPSKPIK